MAPNYYSSNNQDLIIENKYIHITNKPVQQNIYSIYLTGSIGKPQHYRDMFNLLRQSANTDIFCIYMNNFGGYVHTGIDIIAAMDSCAGSIYSILTGPVYSMAPLIALHADKIYVEDHTYMMFHDYSGGTVGKGHEQDAAIRNDKPFFDEVFTSTTKKFLTKGEIRQVLAGKDLYVRRDSIIQRLTKIGKLQNEPSKSA